MSHMNSLGRMAELFKLVASGRKLELWCELDEAWRDAAINIDPSSEIARYIKYRVKTPAYPEALAIAIDDLDNEEWGNNEECYQSMFDKGIEYQKSLNNQSEAPVEGVEEVIKGKAIQSPSVHFGDAHKRFHEENALLIFNGDIYSNF